MAKRKIEDLGDNECIHCPTEESIDLICQLLDLTKPCKNLSVSWENERYNQMVTGTSCVIHPNIFAFYPNRNTTDGRHYTVYPRTDFFDDPIDKAFDELEKDGFIESIKKPSDTVEVQSEVSRPDVFRTGDEVICGDTLEKCTFLGYTTDGLYIAEPVRQDGNEAEVYDKCRPFIEKKQHTITCTDEVLEKIKSIEGVVVE